MSYSFHHYKEMEKLFQRRQWDFRILRKLRRRLYKEFIDPYALEDLSAEMKAELQEQFPLTELKLLVRQDSQEDGASKCLLETHDGHKIEMVILRIATGRVSLCVSSQVGCTENCSFCSTASLGFKRNLTVGEILAQLHLANQILKEEGLQVRNLVFMGMGEPLRNLYNLYHAIEMMTIPQAYSLSPLRVTVSTLGLPREMLALAKRYPQVSLALSLHSADEQKRSQLMPINERHSLNDLHEALAEIEVIRGNREILIEYLVLDGQNDSIEAAEQLNQWLGNLKAWVNLIPYNNSLGYGEYKSAKSERVDAFQAYLKERERKVTRRYSLGQDIDAACGQLASKSK